MTKNVAILLPYMSRKEEYQGRHPREPIVPSPLSPDLAAFLETQPVACVNHETGEGKADVFKLLAVEIDSVAELTDGVCHGCTEEVDDVHDPEPRPTT